MNELIRASLLFCALLLAGPALLACSDEAAPTVVERPNAFRQTLPDGWRVIVPEILKEREGDGPQRVPAFAAYSPDEPNVTWMVFQEDSSSSIEEVAVLAEDRFFGELGDFVRTESAGDIRLSASGPTKGLDQEGNISVIRFKSRPDQAWIASCIAPKLKDSACQELAEGFREYSR